MLRNQVGLCDIARQVLDKISHCIVPVVVCWLSSSVVKTQQAISFFRVNQSAMNHLVSLVTVSGPSETLPRCHGSWPLCVFEWVCHSQQASTHFSSPLLFEVHGGQGAARTPAKKQASHLDAEFGDGLLFVCLCEIDSRAMGSNSRIHIQGD